MAVLFIISHRLDPTLEPYRVSPTYFPLLGYGAALPGLRLLCYHNGDLEAGRLWPTFAMREIG